MGRLIAGGDSFTYGSELKDCYRLDENNLPLEQVSSYTFPALLANELKLEYSCAALPGYSNSAIRRTTIDECEKYQDIDLVLVTWSFANRFEFRFAHGWEQISLWSIEENVEQKILKEFQNANPIVFKSHLDKLQREKQLGIKNVADPFYKYIGHTDYWCSYQSILDVVFLTNYLKLRKIPYLFLSADENMFKETHVDNSIKSLYSQLDFDNWFWFPKERGFYTWAKEERFPFATTHPLEEAHIEAANLIYEHLRYIGRLP